MADKNILLRNGKALFLAYDQGFEHGPIDFNEKNIDPNYILDIARKSNDYTSIIFHEGLAQSYYHPETMTIPLLLKLNGKTSLHDEQEPYSPQLCSVAEAKRLGAKAIGYTIYIGSEYESKMMEEFSRVEDEAHEQGLLVTMWAYPRGKKVAGKETDRDTVAYGTRLALEMGADFVKVPYTGDIESFRWVVKSAGTTGVLMQGGKKTTMDLFLKDVQDAMTAGAIGVAVGRNVWQSEDPIGVSKKLASIVYGT
jgi:fructose-bisphosphate aldolase, class I